MKQRKCPICEKPADPAHAPFCSQRCQLLDLGQWLQGSYAVPSHETELSDEEEE